MKTIRVVAAVIQRQNNGKDEIFATQRGYGEFVASRCYFGGEDKPG